MARNYSYLLHNPKWNIKRAEVFERDNYECQKCKNTNITVFPKGDERAKIIKGIIISIAKCTSLLGALNSDNGRIFKYRYLVKFKGDDDSEIFKSEILSNVNLNSNELLNFHDCEIYYFNSKRFFIETRTSEDRIVFRIVNKKLTLEKQLFYIKKLHAHHSFYLQDTKPWQYDKGIITLCEYCHEEFHKHNDVPIYNKEGVSIDFIKKGSVVGT